VEVIATDSWDNLEAIDADCNHSDEHYEAVRRFIRKQEITFGGFYHQNGPDGALLFDDGRTFLVSQRVWAGIVADVWGGSYLDYYLL